MMRAKERFFKEVKKKGYFRKRRLLLALSGGKDSMTLFNWLFEQRESLEIELFVAHVNHGLRQASEHEERAIRTKMQGLGIPCFVKHFTGDFTEAAARKFRYDFFAELMAKEKLDVLVTAHHADDQVETFLMREIAGRSLRTLTGISERQAFAGGALIRPLLHFKKSDFDAEDYFEDSSNADSSYFRNRVRNVYIPVMTEENPRFSEGILDLSDELKLAMSVIKEKIQALDIIKPELDLALFRSQSPALQHFILQAYLQQFPDFQPKKATFQRLLAILQKKEQYRQEIQSGYFLIKTARHFYLKKGDENWELEVSEKPLENALEVYLPKGSDYQLRSRAADDVLLLHGQHKKVKKYLIDEKIPLAKRELPLLIANNQVFAVGDMVTSDLSAGLKNDKMKRTLWLKAKVRKD